MSSFFQDLPGPIRERRASLPAHRREDAFLRGGGDDDGYESFAAERERLRGALFGPKQVIRP